MTVKEFKQWLRHNDVPDEATMAVDGLVRGGVGVFHEATYAFLVRSPRWIDGHGLRRFDGYVVTLQHQPRRD